MPLAPDPADKGADQFHPVNRRAGYAADRLARILDYLDRWPFATLASGEGKLLADEIHRLRGTDD
jgi:hypothetical protein